MGTYTSIWGDEMDETNNLTYADFSAGYTAGDGMAILDSDTTVDELISWVFSDKPLWLYDGTKYRLVIHFEAIENGGVIYYFDDDGNIMSHQFGGGES